MSGNGSSRRSRLADASARAFAFFFGLFSLANSIGALLGGAMNGDMWWIDLSFLPPWLAGGLTVIAAGLLVAWGLAPVGSRTSRPVTAACALYSAVAIINAADFYRAWHSGTIAPGAPIPLSIVFAAGFAWLVTRASATASLPEKRAGLMWVVVMAGVFAFVFPVLQFVFFGTTDYRRPADVAVVLGARVYGDGTLSTALEDRVRTAADLYRAGLVTRLLMSGAVGASGVDESFAMRDRAIALGVPEQAILLDRSGVNTDATVAQTTEMFRSLGMTRVLAVSQFWHLPRVKLAYLRVGWNVSTVPATASRPIRQTPYLMLREVPAFWVYWARSVR